MLREAPTWLVAVLAAAVVFAAGGLTVAIANDLGPFGDEDEGTPEARSSSGDTPSDDAESPEGDETDAAGAEGSDEPGPPGTEGNYDLRGPRFHVHGIDATTELTGPTLEPGDVFPSDQPLVYVADTTLRQGDVRRQGLVVLAGERIDVSDASTLAVGTQNMTFGDTVELQPSVELGSPPEPPGLGTWEAAERSAFFADGPADVDFASTTLSGFDRGLFVDGNETISLEGSVELDGGQVYWNAGNVTADSGLSLSLEGSDYTIEGTPSGGELTLADRTVEEPELVHVREGPIEIGDGRVASQGTVRIDQAIDEGRPVIPATVDVEPTRRNLTLEPNGSEHLEFTYEETDRRGVAVLENVTVEGEASPFLRVPLEHPPSVLQQMLATAAEAGPAAPFLAIGIALSAPFVLLAEALSCAFGLCPDPYPTWMDPGGSGTFDVVVEAPEEPGTYEATIVLEGANHEEVALDVALTVQEPAG